MLRVVEVPPELIPEWTVGDRMQKARETAGITVADMADRLGCSRNTVGNMEGGRTRPRLFMLREWSRQTGVPTWWLQGDVPPQKEPAGLRTRHLRLVREAA